MTEAEAQKYADALWIAHLDPLSPRREPGWIVCIPAGHTTYSHFGPFKTRASAACWRDAQPMAGVIVHLGPKPEDNR